MADKSRFERLALVHMDSAFQFAYWIVRNRTDAEDVVQEAYLRAFKGFDGFTGDDIRPWLLTIVRNAAFQRLSQRRRHGVVVPFSDAFSHDKDGQGPEERIASDAPSSEAQLIAKGDQAIVEQAIASLPPAFREIIVLREIEELSYSEISAVIGVPPGTVMSRLSRAREALRQILADKLSEDGPR